MKLIHLKHRTILSVSGNDRRSFLQGLITNDVNRLSSDTPLYACMLNPQGKILFDFLLYEHQETILLDVWNEKAESLMKRLSLYKLRANVEISHSIDWSIYASLDNTKPDPTTAEMVMRDPRHSSLGYRILSTRELDAKNPQKDYETHRLSLGIPESCDIIEDRSFPMELGISDLHGISYTKGCYVGQEVIARNKVRGTLRKAIYSIQSESSLPEMGTVVTINDREIGQIRSISGNIGVAILRIDDVTKAQSEGHTLHANEIEISASLPQWLHLPANIQDSA